MEGLEPLPHTQFMRTQVYSELQSQSWIQQTYDDVVVVVFQNATAGKCTQYLFSAGRRQDYYLASRELYASRHQFSGALPDEAYRYIRHC